MAAFEEQYKHVAFYPEAYTASHKEVLVRLSVRGLRRGICISAHNSSQIVLPFVIEYRSSYTF